VGALVEKCPFVVKIKQIRGFVGEIQAKHSAVGKIETKTAFCEIKSENGTKNARQCRVPV